MKKIFFLFSLIFLVKIAHSQPPNTFIKKIYDRSNTFKIAPYPDGNYILAGTEGFPNDKKIVLIKINNEGEELYKVYIESGKIDTGYVLHAIAVNNAGEIFIGGKMERHSSSYSYKAILIKVNRFANVEWIVEDALPGSHASVDNIILKALDIFIVGKEGIHDDNIIMARYNGKGKSNFIRAYTHDKGGTSACIQFHNLWVMTGHDMLITSRCGDDYLTHIDKYGNLLWEKQMNYDILDIDLKTAALTYKEQVLTGFGGGKVQKYSPVGTLLWEKDISDLTLAPTSDFIPLIDQSILLYDLGNLAAINTNGEIIWENQPTGNYPQHFSRTSFVETTDNGWFIVGKITGGTEKGVYLIKTDNRGNF